MDILPYDDPARLALCLHATFKGSTTEEVRQGSEVLHSMSQDLVRFSHSIISLILNDQNDQQAEAIKNSASVILCTYITNVYAKNIIFSDQKAQILDYVLEAILSRSVTLSIKTNLQDILEKFYEEDDSGFDLRNASMLRVRDILANGIIDDYAGAYIILKQVIDASRASKDTVGDWFRGINKDLISSCSRLITGIADEIHDALASDQRNERFAAVFLAVKVLKLWVAVIKSFLEVLGKPRKVANREPIQSPHITIVTSCKLIVEMFARILKLQVPTEKQLDQCLFSTSGVTGVDQALNTVKATVIKCLNRSIEYMFVGKSCLDPRVNFFYAFLGDQGVKGVMASVLNYCESPAMNLMELEHNLDLQDCLVESLALLKNLSSFSELYTLFSDHQKRLIMNVCLPLLRTTPGELEKFQNHAIEFVALASDTCSEQNSKIAKTQAAQLLEHLCDNVDGATNFFTMKTLAIMEFSIQNQDIRDIPQNFPTLQEFQEGVFLAHTEPRIRLETCLVAFSVLGYKLYKREDLMENLENLLIAYQKDFYGEEVDPLIKSRVILFIGYYFDSIFQRHDQKDILAFQFNYLVESLDQHKQGFHSISEQAIETFLGIFGQEDGRAVLKPFVMQIAHKLLYYVLVAKNPEFFDIVEEFFTNFKTLFLQEPQLICYYFEGMVKRILMETEALQTSEKESSEKLVIEKIFNIIKLVSEDHLFIPKYQEDLERFMEPLFILFEGDQQTEFEDNILTYVYNVIKLTKKISPACWGTLKAYPKIFLRSKGVMSSFFPALNLIIIYGRDQINQDPDALKTLIEIGVEGLNPHHPKATEANSCEAALLLQLIFQYLVGISNHDWDKIIAGAIEKVRLCEHGFLKTKLIGVVFCGFLANFKLTWTIVHNMNFMGQLLIICLDDSTYFDQLYDRKVLITGLCSLLVHGLPDEVIFDRLLDIFNVLVGFLKYIQFMDRRMEKGKKKLQDVDPEEDQMKLVSPKDVLQNFISNTNEADNRGKLNKEIFEEEGNDEDYEDIDEEEMPKSEVSSSDDDSSDEEYLMHPDETESRMILDSFETEFKEKDEFMAFRETVDHLKVNNFDTLAEIVKRMPPTKREYLNMVLNSKRVVVSEKDGMAETRARKIVKATGRKKV